eukprot:TRINITY_DN18824_c0_g1_i1.p1 TRINITY_DN18824_c0_g1~~TRINITY_DN18824_c0_g1_i1.p1  ORF type:complete len:479 (-),score=140.43 TRINITY_DN18824_c0_g1_i1:36-1439(-)
MYGMLVNRGFILRELRDFNRSLGTSSAVLASGKEHRRRKQAHKTREDRLWETQKSMNPFARNVGAARQLRNLGLDKDDGTFKTEDANEAFGNLEETLEDKINRSKAYRKQFKADEENQRELAKRKIIQKKVFPKAPNPSLLTLMEKEMIKYLHKKDSVEWSIERLAESFPATPGVIQKVLKSKTVYVEAAIKKYNKTVVDNWKLLSSGQLELEPEYEKHLKEGNRSLSLSSGEKNLAEQEIRVKLEKTLALPKPAVPGEFASIIVNYNNKLARDKQEASLEVKEVIEMQSLFGENTIPGTPLENEVSPYSETALLVSSIDLSREKLMDIEKFRNLYLKDSKKKKKVEDPNRFREKYLEWVKNEGEKSKFATKAVNKIDAVELSKIGKDNQLLYEAAEREEIDVQLSETGQTFVYDPEAGYKQPYISPENPDTIEIPEGMKNKYNFYQLGDSFYDRDGQFLYRVPGLV